MGVTRKLGADTLASHYAKDRISQSHDQTYFDIWEARIHGTNPRISRRLQTVTLTSSSLTVSLNQQMEIKQRKNKNRGFPYYVSVFLKLWDEEISVSCNGTVCKDTRFNMSHEMWARSIIRTTFLKRFCCNVWWDEVESSFLTDKTPEL